MNDDFENWSVSEWEKWLSLRDEVMGTYFKALEKYNGLPAANALIDREMAKTIDPETLDVAYQVIVPPENSIIHTWSNNSIYAHMSENEWEDALAQEQELDETMEQEANPSDPKDIAALEASEECLKIAGELSDLWISCMSKDIAPQNTKYAIRILYAISQIQFFLIASNDAIYGHFKNKANALVLRAIKDTLILKNYYQTIEKPLNGPEQFLPAIYSLYKLEKAYILDIAKLSFKNEDES